jgi:DNA-binding transcriptional regulator YiaG
MEQPDTTNSTPTKKTPTPTAEITAVPLLQALLYRQRDEMATDRAALKALQRVRAAEIKAVREEEAVKCRNLLNDLKSRYGSYYTA